MTRERKSNIVILCGLCIVLLLFIIFAPSYGWRTRQFFAAPNVISSDNQNVAAENETLKAELAQVQTLQSELPTSSVNDIRAMVYSRYPFNFKNELLVNAGSDQGVASGSAVFFQGMLIGRIQTVWRTTALVQTIFDNNFKMPVRVGVKSYDGLLQGSSYPVVESIAKSSIVNPGDIVYAAGSGFPYGLPIGEVKATSTSADSLFEQASLNFTYDINSIQTVFIQKQP
jgi:rod shape-determining protein MreC